MDRILGTLEGEAERLHASVGLDPGCINCPVELAQRLGIRVLSAPGDWLPGHGYSIGGDEPVVYISDTVSRRRRDFAAAHEVAEVVLGDFSFPDREALADRFGAMILRPRPAVHAAILAAPWLDLRGLAHRLDVSDTCAALRFAEVTGSPVAVVSGRREIRRGAWPLPPRTIAYRRRLPPGAFRTRIDRGRIVVGLS